MSGPVGGFEHGVSAYSNHRCRCDVCRSAFSEYQRNARRERRERLRQDPELAQHGLAATYHNWSCRCRPCTDAASTETMARKQRAQLGLTGPGGRPKEELKHGTMYAYNRYLCRCSECVQASRDHARDLRLKRAQKVRDAKQSRPQHPDSSSN